MKTMTRSAFTRRRFLSYSAALTSLAALGLSVRAQGLEKLTTGFGWIANVEHAPFWRALDGGDFAAAGIDAGFVAGGPGLPNPLVSLSANQIDVAFSDWISVAGAVAKGNDFVIIGSNYPVAPSAFLSLAANPIRTVQDLVGKRILLSNVANTAIVDTILTKAGLPTEYEVVPTGFSPEPLLNGDGDVFLCFATNQPITLEQMGLVAEKDFVVTLLNDLGYTVPTATITVQRSLIETKRELVVGYLKALIAGYESNRQDPAVAAQLVIENYGADYGLDLAQQTRQNELQIPLMSLPGAAGPLLVDVAPIAEVLRQAAAAGGIENAPDPLTVFDMSLAQEALASA